MQSLPVMEAVDMRLEENSFGDLVMKVLPHGISIAKLTREADVDYAYLHSLIRGKRGDKPLRPSIDMVVKIMAALERLNASMTPEWELDLLETAVQLPEGYSITRDEEDLVRENEMIYEADPDIQMITEAYSGTTETGRRAIKSAAELARELSREGSIGKRAE